MLLALVLFVPGAQAKQRYGYFQDLSVTTQAPSSIFLTILYKDAHGKDSFMPRAAVSYRLEAPVSCATGSAGELNISGNEFSKYSYFRQPLRDGLFSQRFENQFEQPQTAPLKGDVKGNVKSRPEARVPRGADAAGEWLVPRRVVGSGTRHLGLHDHRLVLGRPLQAVALPECAQVRQLEEAQPARLQADLVS